MVKAEEYFTDNIRGLVNEAITAAEKQTSGEIRLFIEDNCKEDVLDHAAFIFTELKMNATAERNGVLFYLAMKSKKFAILGDAGINAKVPKDFWEAIKAQMQNHFISGDFSKGLTVGISMAGEALRTYFPYQKGDKNELSNDIVFGK
jgi:uncharacterized membrane protein